MAHQVCLVASGDSRLAANRVCWPAQVALEAAVARAFARLDCTIVRGHPVDPVALHMDIGCAGAVRLPEEETETGEFRA